MAEVNVENMEENAELFMEKMGFAHTSDGLDMTDDQLVNFLLLCHQGQYSDEEEMMPNESWLWIRRSLHDEPDFRRLK